MLLHWAQQLGAPPEVAQGRLAAPARTAADWIARRFGLDSKLVRLLVTTFCREVHLYLTEPAAATPCATRSPTPSQATSPQR